MKIILIMVGKTGKNYLREGMNDYFARIRKMNLFEIITIPDLKNRRSLPESVQKKKEADNISAMITPGDYTILLDEHGSNRDTKEFASLLEKHMITGTRRLLFIIGGPYGFSPSLVERADFRLSLSDLTFSHQLVRLLFLEQLYRAFTIIKGLPYHNE